MLGALGFYVFKRTREADELVRQSIAAAAASVEAENARKLKAAEEAFLASQKASAAAASASAAASAARPARKPKAVPARRPTP